MLVPARQSMHDAVCDVITSQTRAVKNVTRINNYIEGGGGTMRINRWVCVHHTINSEGPDRYPDTDSII